MARLRGTVLSLAAVALVGCAFDDATGIERRELPAILEYHGQSENVLTTPASVAANTDFDVIVSSYGGGCDQQGWVDAHQSESTIDLEVYDLVGMPNEKVFCPGILLRFTHRVTLRAPDSGDITLRVHGRSEPGDAPLIIEHTITVE